MLFSSFPFFIFFSFYFTAHKLTPERWRLLLIILGGTIFYGYWNPAYLLLPYLLTLTSYWGTKWMGEARGRARRLRLALLIATLLLPLLFFKYLDFFWGQILMIAGKHPDKVLGLALPLGISFVTFTLIAYVVDAFRQDKPAATGPGELLACVLFFPHLIAGPIVRPSQLIPALESTRAPSREKRLFGLFLFSWGLFKKLAFADQLSPLVNSVYSGATPLNTASALFAVYGFTVQIYCDFSGYTDMAVGLATILGVRLPNNFNRPYCSANLIEFWHRWHITLSTWLRDYLYIPLGGNRAGRLLQLRNIMITMMLGGLWHGANWNFVIWGVIHGVGIAIAHLYRWCARGGSGFKIPQWFSIFITFHFTAAAWIFFRASTTAAAMRIFREVFSEFSWNHSDYGLYGWLLIGLALAVHRFDSHGRWRLLNKKWRRRWIYGAILFLWCIALAVSEGSSAQFIYFDF